MICKKTLALAFALTVCLQSVSARDISEKCFSSAATGSALSALRYCRLAAGQKDADAKIVMTYADLLAGRIGRMNPQPEKALENYHRAASADTSSPDARWRLASILLKLHRYEEALEQFGTAAGLGHPDAEYQLGAMLAKGQGAAGDRNAAFLHFKNAAESGEARAQLALMEYYSLGVPKLDVREGYFWALAASENGNYAARSALASNARRLSPAEQTAAMDRVRQWLASQGDEEEKCLRLYRMNSANAAFGFCLRAAAASAKPEVALIAATLLSSPPSGGNPDETRAQKWYLKAAAGGNAEASYRLGLLYDRQIRGMTADESRRQALEYFLAAAARNHQNACLKAGIAYETGRGTLKNSRQAAAWYEKAAMLGSEEAAYLLGMLRAGEKNNPDAVFWLSVADRWGYRTAGARLISVRGRLGSNEAKAVEEKVEKFIADDLSSN
ncbi:MAG: sel1 repeat family protein [Succinivibrionaceae bacterium]|nr:sel1 repeat family protein [Succinivibrionaceae bacterium]